MSVHKPTDADIAATQGMLDVFGQIIAAGRVYRIEDMPRRAPTHRLPDLGHAVDPPQFTGPKE